MKRIEIEIYTDESGLFRAIDASSGNQAFEGEPFLLAGLVMLNGGFDSVATRELWADLGLGPPSRFHAAERPPEQRRALDGAARKAIAALDHAAGVQVEAVAHRYRAAVGLPRADVYLDLVFHLVLGAVRGAVGFVAQHADRAGWVPLKLELNLARRGGLNLRPLEKALERAIARDLRLSSLGVHVGSNKRSDYRERGVNLNAVHVHCGVIPVQQSVQLTLSDLLCNALFRWLAQDRAGSERVRLVSFADLEIVEAPTWSAIMADDPIGPIGPRLEPPTGAATLPDRLLAWTRTEPRWTLGGLRSAGFWPQTESPESRAAAIRSLIETAEDASERLRDLDAADARSRLVAAMLADPDWRKGIRPEQRERLELDCDSVRLGCANHRGEPLPSSFEMGALRRRSGKLVGDAANHDAIALLHNRIAVNSMNRFAFGESAQQSQELLAVLRTERGGFSSVFGAAPTPSWQFGALLGTAGQALALRGWATRDASLIQQGIDCFIEAGQQFDKPSDKQRQCAYLAHAHLDLIRLSPDSEPAPEWLAMLELISDELDTDVAGYCGEPLGPDAWRQAFAVHVRLKEAWVLGNEPLWAAPLAECLEALTGGEPLSHPQQQVAGLLALLLNLSDEHRLVRAVAATAKAGNTLVHVIARVYALDLAARRSTPTKQDLLAFEESLPDWLRPRWLSEGMQEAMNQALDGGTPFVDALPFNYFVSARASAGRRACDGHEGSAHERAA